LLLLKADATSVSQNLASRKNQRQNNTYLTSLGDPPFLQVAESPPDSPTNHTINYHPRPPPKMKPATAIFTLQSALLLSNALYTFFFPAAASSPPSPLEGTPIAVIHAMSLSSLGLAISYGFAAYRGDRAFMWAAVPGRFLAAAIFAWHGGPWGWRGVAGFEVLTGGLSLGALWWEG
jgi:hypothetical protein